MKVLKDNPKGLGKADMRPELPSDLQTDEYYRNIKTHIDALIDGGLIEKAGGSKTKMIYKPVKKARS